MGITDRGLVLACSAIGAGLALIAGIGPGVRVSQQDMVLLRLEEIRERRVISPLRCFLDRP